MSRPNCHLILQFQLKFHRKSCPTIQNYLGQCMINIQTTLKLSAEYMGNVDHSNFDSWYERGLEIIGINALVCLAIIAVSIRLAYLQCLPRHFVTNEYLLLGQHLPADTYFPLPYFWNYAMVSFDCGVFLHCIDPGCSRHC